MSGNCQNCLHWGPPTAKTGDPVRLVGNSSPTLRPSMHLARYRCDRLRLIESSACSRDSVKVLQHIMGAISQTPFVDRKVGEPCVPDADLHVRFACASDSCS